MKKTIINFPRTPSSANEENVLWLCAVSSTFSERFYSCKYKPDSDSWVIDVRSNSIDGLVALLHQCACTMGFSENEVAQG